ncbi:7-cyano-7-deazaguanine synthase QueC [Microaerobacter geothermalis]|uniref:7-cyano-7-deazaguanine synthase QueC n=1 Tax=Microaerobacter geothermalis TaxID=674972 RepID=UPI001F335F2E|nr:7-cyano-7-deazaguanine synthase QueC [Microaerobacter geothermalis]MCF6093505.1 7-cyano-7-deazaguanine synthase QueC [Microaerobacter geothermalis]
MEKEKAVVVLSGGLDSTTCMGIAKQEGYELYPITFDYGQRHRREVEQAKQIAQFYNVKKHLIVPLDFLKQIGGSALTDDNIQVRQDGVEEDIPDTYVPARNLTFLSLATAYAEVMGARVIYIGVSHVDYSGYPDCRPEFIRSMEETVNLATKTGVSNERIMIKAPLIQLSKGETIKWGLSLGVPYHLTTSCYLGDELACGLCDSCRLRIQGFKWNKATDPVPYGIEVDWDLSDKKEK